MKINLAAAARLIPLTALILGACVSEKAYEAQTQQLKQAQAQSAAEQAQIAKMQQENKWVVAGDVLFPEGGYQLSASGQAALSQYLPKLQNLQNAKVVVYGYTDNKPIGPGLKQAGIANNIDLSSRRADNVVAYFRSQGVNPNILSAKGFGDTHAVASNDTPDGRAQNRRIEIVLEGPVPDARPRRGSISTMPREVTAIVPFSQGREGEDMNGLRVLRIAGIEPVKALLILSPLLLLFTGCGVTQDRNVRAFDACLTRHAQDAVICEAPLQAYEVDLPTLAARSLPGTGLGQ